MTWYKFKSLGFILAHKFQNLEINKDVLETCMFPILLCGVQTRSPMGKEKRILRTCSRRWKEEYCKLYEETGWRKLKEGSEPTRRTSWQRLTVRLEMERPCGINGPALVGKRYINVGRKNRQKGSTEDPMTDTYKRVSGGQWARVTKNRSECCRRKQYS